MEWKPIEEYEGIYEVSDSGIIYSAHRITSDGKELTGKVIKGGCYPNGYKFVCLRKNGRNKNVMVHRLVAEAFIPNPNNLPCVNHKDGNKQNNCAENLEWCTQSYNLKHAVEIGLVENQCKIRRKVFVTDTLWGKTISFDTMQKCCEYFGFTKSWLGNYIRNHGNPCEYRGYEIYVSKRG